MNCGASPIVEWILNYANSSIESPKSSAGPWPLKTEPRVVVENETEGKDLVQSN